MVMRCLLPLPVQVLGRLPNVLVTALRLEPAHEALNRAVKSIAVRLGMGRLLVWVVTGFTGTPKSMQCLEHRGWFA